MDVGRRSQTKIWMNEFLFVRGMIKGPDATPLYKYHVTDDEYSELPTVLKQSLRDIESPAYSRYWSAAFCLYVAERYRREYDGFNLGWSWAGFEKPLSIELPSRLHSECVKKGLEFWKRPIRLRTNGFDYLGSLFDEGGLPWRLIQSETHGFGRAVRGALAAYYREKQASGDLISVITSYEQYFPQSFRTIEKYLLIASIVEWLMGLAESHPISTLDNPVGYLDERVPGWRKESPLPVGEENARRLINDWLIDAGKSREERIRLEGDEKNYTCEHLLRGTYTDWSIETLVFLPAEIEIEPEGQLIQSTRLEVAFYEGETLIQRSGIAHGKVSGDRTKITVKVNSRVTPVMRSQLELPLTIQFLSSGQAIHACYFENSEIEFQNMPMIFVEDGDRNKLLSTVSTIIPAQRAVVRMPQTVTSESPEDYGVLAEDQWGGKWLEVTDDLVFDALGSKIALRFDPRAIAEKPVLEGTVALYDTLPNLVYRGWPRTQGANNCREQHRLVVNGVPLIHDYQHEWVGSFAVIVEGDSGETLLRRKIGVIPKDLRILAVPASANNAARIIFRTTQKLNIELSNEGLRGEIQESSEGFDLALEVLPGRDAPERLNIAMWDGASPGDPVVLRLPFPKTGVQLFDDLGREIKGASVSLDQLIEMSMTLTPRPDVREQFFISLELISQDPPNFRRHYPLPANNQAQRISLFALEEDIQQMLGTTTSQDAFVRVRVDTDRLLKQVDIVRYNARLAGPNAVGRLEVVTETTNSDSGRVNICGMRLDDPSAVAVNVPERTSEGVGMGVFEIPQKMMKNGPWLLFPSADSTIRFRPTVWVTEDHKASVEPIAKTLHAAAKQFHPTDNPDPFTDVVAAMAKDFGHSGWSYLRSLKEGYSSLPLSAFESWKALARNPSALAAAVFRLEFTPTLCGRMSNELAVIWETVAVQTWIEARSAQRGFLIEQGVPEVFSEKLVDDRIKAVAPTIPCFQYLSDYIREPEHTNLQQAPYVVAKMFFEDLRRNHADDQRWPELLNVELTNWIHQQSFPSEIKSVADVGFSRAVAYLPVFMAAVTAGKTDFLALTERLSELRFAVRVLSDFDREGWYEPIYSLVLSNLLFESDE